MSCHVDNKPQGWCASLAFVARSQLPFYNNHVSSFPGGLWLTAPEKITDSFLFSKLKGVGLSPAKCGGEVEEGKQLSWRHPAKPLVSGVVGGRSSILLGSGWARLSPEPRQHGHGAGHRVAVHSPAIRWAEGGLAPVMGHRGWMPRWVGGGKNGSFVSSAQRLSFMASLCYSCSVGYGQTQDDNLYPKANWLWYGATPFRFA